MTRKPPSNPPDALDRKPDDRITQVREYRLITPLFGGGVETGAADPVTIIRASEIRGQLRFWWRATRGGQFGNLEKLKAAEDALWGAASTAEEARPSLVQVCVKLLSEGCKDHPYEVILGAPNQQGQRRLRSRFLNTSVVPFYAAFPLQPDRNDPGYREGMETKAVRVGVRFQLELTWNNVWSAKVRTLFSDAPNKEIEAALWAWETFGGIGARTRRGFGALQCRQATENGKSIPPSMLSPGASSTAEVREWISKRLECYTSAQATWPEAMPHLSVEGLTRHLKITNQGAAPQTFITRTWIELFRNCQSGENVNQSLETMKKWHYLIERLRDFRQARNPGNPAGRSRWPEPSVIRSLAEQSLPAHQKPIPDPAVEKFPRAAFGLPIIFQFKDSHASRTDREPRMTELRLKTHERLASPLILRPFSCRDGHTVGLALVLDGSGLFRLDESGNPAEYEPLKLEAREGASLGSNAQKLFAGLDAAEAARLTTHLDNPLLNGETDVLKAFLDTL